MRIVIVRKEDGVESGEHLPLWLLSVPLDYCNKNVKTKWKSGQK